MLLRENIPVLILRAYVADSIPLIISMRLESKKILTVCLRVHLKNATAMYKCIANGDLAGARVHLHNILLLRDTMINHGLLRCFTVCMNLLGYKGDFHYDYNKEIDLDKVTPIMRDIMQTVGEL